MELLLPQSRWPEANCASCFQNSPCLYIHSPHTNSKKKNPTGTKQKQAHAKNRSLTHVPRPTVIQISVISFCSIKWTIFSSCLTWLFEHFLKHLLLCNRNWTALWKLPRPGPSDILLPRISWRLYGFSVSVSWVLLSLPSPTSTVTVPWDAHLHALTILLLKGTGGYI